MDFEKLVSPITNYLNYIIEYWSWNDSAIIENAEPDAVSTNALLLAIVGLGLFLVFRYWKMNVIPRDPDIADRHGPETNQSTLISMLSFAFVVPLFFEFSLVILGFRQSDEFGNIYDTLNAGLLSYAAFQPLAAAQGRLSALVASMKKANRTAHRFSLVLSVPAHIAILALAFLALRPYPVLLNADPIELLWPSLMAFLMFLILMILITYFLFVWNTYLEKRERNSGP